MPSFGWYKLLVRDFIFYRLSSVSTFVSEIFTPPGSWAYTASSYEIEAVFWNPYVVNQLFFTFLERSTRLRPSITSQVALA
jgi:hypothetical protein